MDNKVKLIVAAGVATAAVAVLGYSWIRHLRYSSSSINDDADDVERDESIDEEFDEGSETNSADGKPTKNDVRMNGKTGTNNNATDAFTDLVDVNNIPSHANNTSNEQSTDRVGFVDGSNEQQLLGDSNLDSEKKCDVRITESDEKSSCRANCCNGGKDVTKIAAQLSILMKEVKGLKESLTCIQLYQDTICNDIWMNFLEQTEEIDHLKLQLKSLSEGEKNRNDKINKTTSHSKLLVLLEQLKQQEHDVIPISDTLDSKLVRAQNQTAAADHYSEFSNEKKKLIGTPAISDTTNNGPSSISSVVIDAATTSHKANSGSDVEGTINGKMKTPQPVNAIFQVPTSSSSANINPIDDSQWEFNINWINVNAQTQQTDHHEHVVLIQPYKQSRKKDYKKIDSSYVSLPYWFFQVDKMNKTGKYPKISIRLQKEALPSRKYVLLIHTDKCKCVPELNKIFVVNHGISIPVNDKEGKRALVFGYVAANLLMAIADHRSNKQNTRSLPVTFTNWGSFATMFFLPEIDSMKIDKKLIVQGMCIEEWDIQTYQYYKNTSVSQPHQTISNDDESTALNEIQRLGICHRNLMVQNAIKMADSVSFDTDKNEVLKLSGDEKLLAHWIFMQPRGINHLKMANI